MKPTFALIVLAAISCSAFAKPAPPASLDPAAARSLLDATAETTIRRLPTCEAAINTRVAEWKAAASIACRKSPASVDACVASQLTARAEQLKRLRSCRVF